VRNCIRFVLGCVLAAALVDGVAAQPTVNPVVAPVRGGWTPRVIATTRPVTDQEPAQPPAVQPARPQPADTSPLVRPVTPPETVRPVVDTSTVPKPAPAGACLVVEKVGVGAPAAGNSLVYDIIVHNIGAAEAQRVRVEEQLPAGTTVLATEPRAEARDNSLVWELGHLAAGGEARLRVTVQPSSDGEFATTASVSCATFCTMHVHAKKTAPVLVNVRSPGSILVGQKATFRIELVNLRSAPLSKLMLKATLPAGLQHPQGAEIEALIPSVAAGATETVSLEVTAAKAGRQVLAVTATAGAASISAVGVVEVKDAASPAPVPSSVTGSPEVHPPMVPSATEPKRSEVSPIPPLPPPVPPPQSQLVPRKHTPVEMDQLMCICESLRFCKESVCQMGWRALFSPHPTRAHAITRAAPGHDGRRQGEGIPRLVFSDVHGGGAAGLDAAVTFWFRRVECLATLRRSVAKRS
jgi:uncharacterized repeat protein (TIGR01451 family)